MSIQPSSESERLRVFREPDPSLERIARLCAWVCQTPSSAILIWDGKQLWTQACSGSEKSPPASVSGELGFGVHALQEKEFLLVRDALKDSRFANPAWVDDVPKVRFFLGIPLFFGSRVTPIGCLCVWDTRAREPIDAQLDALKTLSEYVETRFERLPELFRRVGKMAELGEMVAGIAHEINNPLAIVHGRAGQIRMLAEKGVSDAGEFGRLAGMIESTAMRIAKIVKSLKAYTREATHDPMEEISVKTLVDDTLDLCRERFASHGITLQSEDVPDLLRIKCRPVEISEVLLNLLNNAFDAVRELDEKWVRISAEDRGTEVLVTITDSGKGIAPEIISRLFDRYFTTKPPGIGTGLGLHLARTIVESHGGKLQLNSHSGNTQFLLVLPKQQTAATRFVAARGDH